MKKVAIVGAGIGGLLTARLLQGHVEIELFEAGEVGGRARSLPIADVPVNLGAHALYQKGVFREVLSSLGIHPPGEQPTQSICELEDGRLQAAPTTVGALMKHSSMSMADRAQFARAYAIILVDRVDDSHSFESWSSRFGAKAARRLMMLARLATYMNDVGRLPARLVCEQLRLAVGGVIYVDGGWQMIVEALSAPIEDRIITERVQSVDAHQDAVTLVTASGSRHFDDVVLACGLKKAERLFGLGRCGHEPVLVSTLDLVLRERPSSMPSLVLGVDEPVYVAEHSRVAEFGGIVLHVVRYDCAGRDSIESTLDGVVPEWRSLVREDRFMRRIAVADLRPDCRIEGRWHERVHCVGDWTLGAGRAFLSDAVAESARSVAEVIRRDCDGRSNSASIRDAS